MKLKRISYMRQEHPQMCLGKQLRRAVYRDQGKDEPTLPWPCHDGANRSPAKFVNDSGWWLIADDDSKDEQFPPIGPFPSLRAALVVLTLSET